jgi:hypothetical protein
MGGLGGRGASRNPAAGDFYALKEADLPLNESNPQDKFSVALITLMKGVTYAENDPGVWQGVLTLQPRIREHVAWMGLELVIDEAEGYAYLRQRAFADEETGELPRLIPRRPLSFPVSLLLALLRKKLAEFDAVGGDTRLIVSRADLVEALRVFLPDTANEARLFEKVNAHLNKVVDLGFLRRLSGQEENFEVRRILKAFVDAQWLQAFDERLKEYQASAQALLHGKESLG